MADGRIGYYTGMDIIITTKHPQKKTSKIKWLNKIYAKLFGYDTVEVQEVGKMTFLDDKVYMTETDYKNLKEITTFIPIGGCHNE